MLIGEAGLSSELSLIFCLNNLNLRTNQNGFHDEYSIVQVVCSRQACKRDGGKNWDGGPKSTWGCIPLQAWFKVNY
jgi:hypothetical protein